MEPEKRIDGVALGVWTAIIYGAFLALYVACSHVRDAAEQGCPYIKLLAQGCDMVTLELPDGGKLQVSRDELELAAKRTSVSLRDGGVR